MTTLKRQLLAQWKQTLDHLLIQEAAQGQTPAIEIVNEIAHARQQIQQLQAELNVPSTLTKAITGTMTIQHHSSTSTSSRTIPGHVVDNRMVFDVEFDLTAMAAGDRLTGQLEIKKE